MYLTELHRQEPCSTLAAISLLECDFGKERTDSLCKSRIAKTMRAAIGNQETPRKFAAVVEKFTREDNNEEG